jgi:hypothetical protein
VRSYHRIYINPVVIGCGENSVRNISIVLKTGSVSGLGREGRGGVWRKKLSEYLSLIKNDKVVKC